MNKPSRNIFLSTVIAALAAGASAVSMADAIPETRVQTTAEGLRTLTVSYADLDMGSPEAQETLYYRLRSAAEEVCGSSDFRETASLRQASANKSCFNDTLDDALSQASAGQVAVVVSQ